MTMLEKFELDPDTPSDVIGFERYMLGSLLMGALVATAIADDIVDEFGRWTGPAILVLWLALGMLLTLLVSRKRSNAARWALTLGSMAALVPYAVYAQNMFDHFLTGYVSLGQLALLALAIFKLFSPASRAWFHGEAYHHVDADGVIDDD